MQNTNTVIEMDFSTQQLLQLIAEESNVINGNGLTSNEIAQSLGISLDRVRAILHELKKNGMLIIRHGYREYLDGKRGTVPVYSVRLHEQSS